MNNRNLKLDSDFFGTPCIFYFSFDSVKLYINIGLSFWKASSRKVYAVPVVQNATSTMTKRERENSTAPTMTVGDDSDESLSQLQEEKKAKIIKLFQYR